MLAKSAIGDIGGCRQSATRKKRFTDSCDARFALINQRNESARTYVAHRDGLVVGYYSISTGDVSVEEAPARISKGLARHAIPVILLARLAVDKDAQGGGLGKALLKDALARIAQAADIVGARAVLVHAIDQQAKKFYEHFDFEPSAVH
jgi:GNAT superfamily N-acetyltransferase